MTGAIRKVHSPDCRLPFVMDGSIQRLPRGAVAATCTYGAPFPAPRFLAALKKVISAIPQLDRLPPSMALGPGFLPGRRATKVTAVPVIPARIPAPRARDGYFSVPAELRR